MDDKLQYSLLSPKLSQGPHNLGDPNDTTLRRVEIDVLIPQLMREKARTEKCQTEVQEFSKCCADNNVLMVVKCRNQNSALKSCLTKWYTNEKFKEECTQQYLNERRKFRSTGIPNKSRFSQLKSS
ncbi:COX assembly mitochondrial protein homolog [Halictus rubicundus]|uniref:COX assembly mitochondrial protein homolog n=1 Tax=Halictus rubicundus TaxID=77578 RepID=UPI00403605D0